MERKTYLLTFKDKTVKQVVLNRKQTIEIIAVHYSRPEDHLRNLRIMFTDSIQFPGGWITRYN